MDEKYVKDKDDRVKDRDEVSLSVTIGDDSFNFTGPLNTGVLEVYKSWLKAIAPVELVDAPALAKQLRERAKSIEAAATQLEGLADKMGSTATTPSA